MKRPFREFEDLLTSHPYRTRWQPAADVYRTNEGWLVKVELAGVRQEEFEVRVRGAELILRGRRRDWQVRDVGECQSMEITYDEFERHFEFPIDLTTAGIRTEYVDGMLIVRITSGKPQP